MNTKTITRTAILIALLIALQAATRPLGNQFVTGSCVNLVLAVAAMLCGVWSGVIVAIVSPFFAYFLGISPQLWLAPAIACGNAVYVVLIALLSKKIPGAAGGAVPAADNPDPEKYEILGVAGKGGTGTVYRALDRFLGIEVAVKIVNRELLADPDVMTAFKDEARITMQLSHPNILRLYSFQENRGCPYIVMELVRGTSLREAILGNGALSTLTACQVLAQCASALGYAHMYNVVHKDVKPENIFIDEAGALKIIDFGAAVLNDIRAQSSGDIVGTPEYMCPEQLRGDPVGPGADIYALGVMTYLMLVGCFPFPPDTTVDRLLAGLRPDFSALSPELAAVLDRATAYDPAFRYASVAEFAQDAIRACGCESVMFNPFAPIEIIPAQLPDAAPPEPAYGDAPDDPTAPQYDYPDDPTAPVYGEAPQEG